MHDTLSDLTEIALVATVAVLLGFAFMRIRQPPIVAYILAGLILGPTGLGFVQHTESITLLAELGVLMLLFIIGMELSIRAFMMVLRPSVVIVTGQLVSALAITSVFGWVLEWPIERILVLAFIVAMSSTAVAIKILDEIGELRTETGRITVGIMIAQDIAIVPMLILTTALGKSSASIDALGWTIALKMIFAIGVLVALLWFLGRPGKIRLPGTDLIHERNDMIALAMLAFCFAAATVSGLLGLSAAYGAFVAGLIVSSSTLRAEAISVTEPIQSILIFIFFLSVGLLLDLNYIRENWVVVGLFAGGAIIIKTVLNVLLVRYSNFSWDVAFPAGLATAQIGEFSFILAAIGFSNRVLDSDTYRLALSVIAVTLIVSPIWMISVRRFHDVARAGISDLRGAFAEVYSGEIDEFERSARFVGRQIFRVRRYYRASRLAWSRRKRRRDKANAGLADQKPADEQADVKAASGHQVDAGPKASEKS